jgi:hypothetical protein
VHRKFGNIISIVIALSAITGAAHAASLVNNGSFEEGSPAFPDEVGVGFGASDTLPSWTVVGQLGRASPIAWLGPSGAYYVHASAGRYFLDLTGNQGGQPYGGVTQTINTVIGQNYQLTFDLGSSAAWGLPSGIAASVGDVASGVFGSNNLSLDNYWETKTLNFTADSTTTLISLIGNAGNNYIGLDNVSVVGLNTSATPLPAALPLFATGLGALGLLGWRRKRKAAAAIAA